MLQDARAYPLMRTFLTAAATGAIRSSTFFKSSGTKGFCNTERPL